MPYQGCWLRTKHYFFLIVIFFYLPSFAHASFIESTMGTAVVNDATATYYNPAALVQLQNPQWVVLNSISYFHSELTGTLTQLATNSTLSGTSRGTNQYYLPAIYFGTPITNKTTLGLAIVANDVNRDIDGNSTLRYLQSNSDIQDIDFVPALSLKLNDYIAMGLGITFSRAYFLMKPIYGLASFNLPDSQSRNQSEGTSYGADIGILIKPDLSTVIGLNYREAMTYRMSGTSTVNALTSPNYHFDYWTPARSVFSINHFITKKLGFIATVQYIQWNIFQHVTAHQLAVPVGTQAVILPTVTSQYHFHNSWLLTLGSHYRLTPNWILRIAGSYIQSPSNGSYQIDNGDSFILGGSMGYQITRSILIDGSYAHAFVENKNIHIVSPLQTIEGVNKNAGNAFSLKLTFSA